MRAAGLRLKVLPTVFNPAIHFTSAYLAEYLAMPDVIKPGERVLDLGTGSGIVAIAAARGGAGHVVATDINPAAVRCAAGNVRRYGLEVRVQIRQGDLFEPVRGEQFDLIVSNPPFFRGEPKSPGEYAYYAGRNYEWLHRFATEVGDHMASHARCLLVLGDAADVPSVLERLRHAGREPLVIVSRDILVETLSIISI